MWNRMVLVGLAVLCACGRASQGGSAVVPERVTPKAVSSPRALLPEPRRTDDEFVGIGEGEHPNRQAAVEEAEMAASGSLVTQLQAAVSDLAKMDRNIRDTAVVLRANRTIEKVASGCLSHRFTYLPLEPLPNGFWRARVEARLARPTAGAISIVGPDAAQRCAGLSLR